MEACPRLAMVCGPRRELYPQASVYNAPCDAEWNTPLGDTESCGGDALALMAALREAGGYDERVVAGEEPEPWARLRARGWGMRRIDREMTRHDAAMTRVVHWWRRSRRSGHGLAQVGAIHGALGSARRPPP